MSLYDQAIEVLYKYLQSHTILHNWKGITISRNTSIKDTFKATRDIVDFAYDLNCVNQSRWVSKMTKEVQALYIEELKGDIRAINQKIEDIAKTN
jgi:hypothetical protein